MNKRVFYNASDGEKVFLEKGKKNYAKSHVKSSLHTRNRTFIAVMLFMKGETLVNIAKDRSYELVHLGTAKAVHSLVCVLP